VFAGLLKKHLPDSSLMKIRESGKMTHSKLSRELRRVSLSFGATNVIILGVPITAHLSFISPLKKINTEF